MGTLVGFTTLCVRDDYHGGLNNGIHSKLSSFLKLDGVGLAI